MTQFSDRIIGLFKKGREALTKIVAPDRSALVEEIARLAGDAKQDWRSPEGPPPGAGHFVTDLNDKQIAIFKYIGVDGHTRFRARIHDRPSQMVGVEGLSDERKIPDNSRLREIFTTLENRYNKTPNWVVRADPNIPWSVYY